MEVDRRAFLATVGVGALEFMSPEDKAEELEHYMEHMLDDAITARDGTEAVRYMPDGEALALAELQQEPRSPRGTGRLFMPRSHEYAPMSTNPTLVEYFEKRFAPANHVLQSATYALETGQTERTIFACLMHDVVLNMIKGDHGWWGRLAARRAVTIAWTTPPRWPRWSRTVARTVTTTGLPRACWPWWPTASKACRSSTSP